MPDDNLRKMVLSSEETEKRIDDLSNPPHRLSRSAAYRAGIKFLHDYLINDKLPDVEKSRAKPDQG